MSTLNGNPPLRVPAALGAVLSPFAIVGSFRIAASLSPARSLQLTAPPRRGLLVGHCDNKRIH